MIIGYARVSTEEQNLDLQRDALHAAGCDKLFEDHGVSGATIDRDGLTQALGAIGEGDTLIVWRLDRLGRSIGFLIDLIDRLGKQGAHFKSISDGIDTSSSTGKLVFHIMGALAEFERSLISERTKAGMESAKARGRRLGRPPALSPAQLKIAQKMLDEGMSQRSVAAEFGVGESTLRGYLPKNKI